MSDDAQAVLDYRNPLTTARQTRIVRLLQFRESLFWIKIITMFLTGPPMLFVGPWLIARLAARAQAAWFVRVPLDTWIVFSVASLFVIPLLFLLEHRTRGRFFEDAARDSGLGDNVGAFGSLRTASRGEWEMQTSIASWAALVEILLLGPRMLMSATRQARTRRHLGPPRFQHPARVVHTLLDHDHGVTLDILLRRGETTEQLWPSLLLLAFHNCIGISKDANRVWLSSDVRRRLAA